MTKQTVNVGTSANDRSGDSLRTAFQKINTNFTEIYDALGLNDFTLNLGAFEFTGSTLSTSDSSDITIAQNVKITSDLYMGGDIIPEVDSNFDLGSPDRQFRSLYVSNDTVYFNNIPLSISDDGTLLINYQVAATPGGALTWDSVIGKPSFSTVATSGDYADLSNKPTIFNGDYNNLSNLPSLSAVALSGDYGDLSNPPTIPADIGDLTDTGNLLFDGNYASLSNKPTIPTLGNFSFSANNITASSGAAPILLKIFGGDAADPPALINREWSFNTNGSITFPDSTTQTTAWTGSAPGFTYNENGETSEISVTADVFDFGDGKTIDMQNSSILFTGSTISGIGDLTLSGDIRSENAINIDINLSDSTLRRWRFGEDGDLTLPAGGDILDSTGTSVLGGGTNSPIQPYLELTNTPFIIQPVTFGEPFTVTAPVSGQGATFDVVITSGPLLSLITVNNAGTGYVAGQRYKIWHNVIGGTGIISDITFEIETVGELGEILTIINPQFASESPDNIPNTYTGVSIELYSSVRDEISPDVILTRGRVQGLYNIVSETEYDNSNYSSPLNTEWNSDGWDNLVGIGGRDFTTFRSALGGQVGNNVVGAELVMRDITTDRYYKFEFTDWGQNNGGSYSYTRTEITDPNFFRKTDDGDEVDIFVADDGEGAGIGITRGGQQGIYNPYRDEGWDGDFTPSGTEWNLDGWDDLSDVESRTYTNFFAAYGNGQLGNRVPGSKAVMYIPETDTYYAIQWLSWTQNANGGGFTYVRYELDLTKLNEGVRFPDGTVLKSAEGVGRVKSTAAGGRRIEEVVGSNTVSVTSVTTTNITATASRTVEGDNRFWVSTASEIFPVIDNPNAYDIQDYATIQFSLDNITWYTYNGGYSGAPGEIGVSTDGSHAYNQGDTIYFRYDSGGAPQVWWDKADLPAGGGNFRGAVIDYHAYTGEATIIGTIHIVDDSGEEHISHTEVASGSTDSENDDLWLVQNEGTISYRRIDGESKTLKIHWTAKVFYGEEFYD